MADLGCKSFDCFLRALEGTGIIPNLGQPKQVERCDRARGWLRAVVVFLHPKEDARVLARAAEVSAPLFIEEQPVLRFLQFNRKLQPANVEGGLVEIEQP